MQCPVVSFWIPFPPRWGVPPACLRHTSALEFRLDYEKLEKVEMSDPVLGKRVKNIFLSYNEVFSNWAKRTQEEGDVVYDPLEPSEVRARGMAACASNCQAVLGPLR